MASRLDKRLREQGQLTYDIRSSIRILTTGNDAWISVQGDFPAVEGNRLADIVKEEVARLAELGITQHELNMAKQTIFGERCQQLGIDRNIQGMLLGQLHEGITMASWVAHNDALASMTLEQINAVVRQYFKVKDMVEIIAGPDIKK